MALVGSAPFVAGGQDSTATPAPAPGKSTVGGVFTDEQAKRGESAYRTYCVNCHSAKQYTGDDFKVAWVSRSAYDIFNTIASEMPEDDPGILARQDYIDIVAYLFQLNGYPVGTSELPTDDDGLRGVKIDPAVPATPPPPPPPHGDWSARQIQQYPAGARPGPPARH